MTKKEDYDRVKREGKEVDHWNYLSKLPNPQGKHVVCINGCGNMVAESVMVCRSCRRKAKLVKARVERKQRKHE